MIIVFVVILILAVYGILVEPHLMRVRRIRRFSGLNLKVAQVSDTHFCWHTSAGRFDKFVKNLQEEKPDMILFTGDLFDKVAWAKEEKRDWSKLKKQLSGLAAPLGKFAILGNHDFDGGNADFVRGFLADCGFVILTNAAAVAGPIAIAGLDDQREGRPDFGLRPEAAEFSLLMIHEPDGAAQLADADRFDLIVAGHSHGGQIRLGNLRLHNDGSKLYDHGLYGIGQRSALYVNSGIGLTFLPIRFGVPPEIVYFEI